MYTVPYVIPQLKKAEALAQLKISSQDHGLQMKKKKVCINLSKRLNSIMDYKTLEAIADIVKLPGAIDAEDEEQ